MIKTVAYLSLSKIHSLFVESERIVRYITTILKLSP